MRIRIARALAALTLALAAVGCGDVCEEAAQVCADEGRVATPEEDEGEVEACEGRLERHARCIADADSCADDVVASCWAEAAEDG